MMGQRVVVLDPAKKAADKTHRRAAADAMVAEARIHVQLQARGDQVVELYPGSRKARLLMSLSRSAGLAEDRIALLKRARSLVPKTFEARMAIDDVDGAAACIPGLNQRVRL